MINLRFVRVIACTSGFALAASGCAATEEPRLAIGGASTILNSGRGRGAVVSGNEAASISTALPATVQVVWPALLQALPAIGIPLGTIDPVSWTAGTQATNARRRFADRPLSATLLCGGAAGIAEVADAYAVSVGVLATLVPNGSQTQLQVTVAGSAKDPYTSVPARQCVSRGNLEQRVDSTVRAILQGR